VSTSRPRLSHQDHLEEINRLAHAIVEEAATEGWLTLDPVEGQGQTALQRSINELARNLRLAHYEDDGCLDH
jgi:hypothetical protein